LTTTQCLTQSSAKLELQSVRVPRKQPIHSIQVRYSKGIRCALFLLPLPQKEEKVYRIGWEPRLVWQATCKIDIIDKIDKIDNAVTYVHVYIYNINISFPYGFSLLFLVVNKHAFWDYHELRFNSIDGLVEFVELVEFVDV